MAKPQEKSLLSSGCLRDGTSKSLGNVSFSGLRWNPWLSSPCYSKIYPPSVSFQPYLAALFLSAEIARVAGETEEDVGLWLWCHTSPGLCGGSPPPCLTLHILLHVLCCLTNGLLTFAQSSCFLQLKQKKRKDLLFEALWKPTRVNQMPLMIIYTHT